MEEKHPEMKDGEIFLNNISTDNFKFVGWKTKRLGTFAYDIEGNVINELRPLFVMREEYVKAFNKNKQWQECCRELGIDIKTGELL